MQKNHLQIFKNAGLLIVFLLFTKLLFAQDGHLTLKGKIENEGGYNSNLSGVKVKLKDGKKVIKTVESNFLGRYKIDIPLNHQYFLYFKVKKFKTLHVKVDTRLPGNKSSNDYKCKLDVKMYKNGEDIKVNHIPYTKVTFNKKKNKFINDKEVQDKFNKSISQQRNKKFAKEQFYYEGKLFNGDNENPIEGAFVYVKEKNGDEILEKDTTGKKGSFSVNVPYNKTVKIFFDAEGYYKPYLLFDTHMDNQFEEKYIVSYNIYLFSKKDPDINPEAFKMPYIRFFYSDKQGKFIKDKEVQKKFTENALITDDEKKENKEKEEVKNTSSDNQKSKVKSKKKSDSVKNTTQQKNKSKTKHIDAKNKSDSSKNSNQNLALNDTIKNLHAQKIKSNKKLKAKDIKLNSSEVEHLTHVKKSNLNKKNDSVKGEKRNKYIHKIHDKSVAETVNFYRHRDSDQTKSINRVKDKKLESTKVKSKASFNKTTVSKNENANKSNINSKNDIRSSRTNDEYEILKQKINFNKRDKKHNNSDVFKVNMKTIVKKDKRDNGVTNYTTFTVFHDGNKLIFTKVKKWWFMNSYYKNGKEITADQYQKQIKHYKSISH